jgi:hypothetical protein
MCASERCEGRVTYRSVGSTGTGYGERGEVLQRGWGCGLEGRSRAGMAGKRVWVGSAGKR